MRRTILLGQKWIPSCCNTGHAMWWVTPDSGLMNTREDYIFLRCEHCVCVCVYVCARACVCVCIVHLFSVAWLWHVCSCCRECFCVGDCVLRLWNCRRCTNV